MWVLNCVRNVGGVNSTVHNICEELTVLGGIEQRGITVKLVQC